jgi:hypothetical protein
MNGPLALQNAFAGVHSLLVVEAFCGGASDPLGRPSVARVSYAEDVWWGDGREATVLSTRVAAVQSFVCAGVILTQMGALGTL